MLTVPLGSFFIQYNDAQLFEEDTRHFKMGLRYYTCPAVNSAKIDSFGFYVSDLLTIEPHTPSPEPQRYQKNGGDWYSQNNKDTTSMFQCNSRDVQI